MEVARTAMVDTQVRPNDVNDRRLISAMYTIAREDFLPESRKALAYSERTLECLPDRYLWESRDFSKLVQGAEIEAGDRVLDIAPGTGYSTEVFSRLAGSVVALESSADGIAALKSRFDGRASVEVVEGDLAAGAAAQGPYDVIFVNGAVGAPSPAWLELLKEGGRLAVVVREGEVGRARIYTRSGSVSSWRTPFEAGAPVLPGFEVAETFRF